MILQPFKAKSNRFFLMIDGGKVTAIFEEGSLIPAGKMTI